MSGKASFDKVELLLVAPKTQNSGIMRQTLNDLDFRDIRLGASIKDIRAALETRPPDLLITDADLPDGDVCNLIAEIRNHRVGSNPFLSIIVTTWAPSESLVRRVVECGADDLLIQPASRGALRTRIDTLTFNRKPFVVTATYIGPDRRTEPRAGHDPVPLLNVPNLLLAKAKGETDPAVLQRVIDAAIASVNIDRLARSGSHIEFLVNRIRTAYQEGRFDHDFIDTLNALLTAAQDTMQRLNGTRFGSVSKLCHALVAVVARMNEAAIRAPDPRDIKLLPELAMSIQLALKDIDRSRDAASQISEAVSGPVRQASSG